MASALSCVSIRMAILKAYDLKLDDVQQHNYFNGKNCPQTIRESGRWQEFLELAESYLKQKNK